MTYPSVPLKHLCVEPPEYGLNIPASEYLADGVRLIRTTDISEHGTLRSEAPVFIDPAAAGDCRLKGGDLLLSRSGTLGRALLWPHDGQDAVSAGYLVRFRPDTDRVDPRFLWYATQATPFQRIVQLEATQSTIANFNAQRYANLRVPAPPLGEQRQIAKFLYTETGRINELARLKRELLSRLTDRVAAVMHEAIIGLHRNARLAYVVSWRSGGTPPKGEATHWWGDLPWASTKDLVRDEIHDTVNHIAEEAAAYSCVVARGSLLVATRGMALAKRLPLAVTTRRMAFNQDLKALVPKSGVDPAYLRVALRGLESEILANVVEAAHGTRRLETRWLKALRLPVPESRIQRAIVERVRKVEEENNAVVSRIERQMSLLIERREALITAAVTGRLDPTSYRASALTT